MANITRIKASDPRKPKNEPESSPKNKKKAKKANQEAAVVKKVEKTTSPAKQQKTEKSVKNTKKPAKKMPVALAIITWPFRMIGKPFVLLGRYIKSSWKELRQVRWPSRKATWKMAGAVLIYTALLIAIIMLLDMLFTWLFSLLLT